MKTYVCPALLTEITDKSTSSVNSGFAFSVMKYIIIFTLFSRICIRTALVLSTDTKYYDGLIRTHY